MPIVSISAAGETATVSYEIEQADGAAPLGTTSYSIPPGAIMVSPGGLKAAVTAAAAGATLVLRGGTYNEQFNTGSNKPLTIQSYPGEAVTLDGKGTMNWTLIAKSRLYLYGIRVRNYITPAPGTFEYGCLFPSGCDGSIIENCIFEDMLGAEARVGRSAMNIYSNSNVTVRNCTFQRNAQLHLNSSNTTNLIITGCLFVDCNKSGTAMAPVTSATKHHFANGLTITGNTFDGAPGCSGVWMDACCYNFKINDNSFTRMGVEGIQCETSGFGEIRRNKVRGNSIYGIRLFDANDVIVDSNDIDGPTVWHIGIMQDERRAANDPNAGYVPPGMTWQS